MPPRGRSDVELWAALHRLDDDPLDPTTPRETIDETLRDAGVDTSALMKRGRAFIAKLQEERRLAWQVDARRRLTAMNEHGRKVVAPADMTRSEMLERLEHLRRHPKYGAPVMTAFRKRRAEESSDEDLKMLLQDIEDLRALEAEDRPDDDGDSG